MTNSMPTSDHHVAGVCCQCESFGVSGPGTNLVRSAVEADAAKSTYRDQALTPVTDDETGTLEIFNATDSARAAVSKARRQKPPSPLRAVWT